MIEHKSTQMLKNVSTLKTLSSIKKEEIEPILWRSIGSEYDSQHFYQHLKKALIPSPELTSFLRNWLRDEEDHAHGFKILYSTMCNVSLQEIDQRLSMREVDFAGITEFLQDEFATCLLLAYDEIITTHVYERSLIFYDSLNCSSIKPWIKKVKTDEARHFLNIIKVIQSTHQNRIPEAECILNKILSVDKSLNEYKGTFVLDHSCPEFPLTNAELMSIGVKTVLKKLRYQYEHNVIL